MTNIEFYIDYNNPHKLKMIMNRLAAYLEKHAPEEYTFLNTIGTFEDNLSAPSRSGSSASAAVNLENTFLGGLEERIFNTRPPAETFRYDQSDRILQAAYKVYGLWRQIGAAVHQQTRCKKQP